MIIDVLLNKTEFLRFGCFDALYCRKVWRTPAVLAAIFSICAVICFLMPQRQGSVLLGIVLMTVGLGLPAVYFLSFYLSLRKQAVKEGLTETRHIYTIELCGSDNRIVVDNGRERAAYPWSQVFHVWQTSTAAYLYITPQRAFLIPYTCVADRAECMWELIASKVPKERYTILKPKHL